MRPAVILFALAAFAMASPIAMEAKEDSVAVPSFYQNLDFVDTTKKPAAPAKTEEKKPGLLSKIDTDKVLDQVKIGVAKGCKVVHGLLTECLAPKTAD